MSRSEGGDPLGGLWSRFLWQQIKGLQTASPSRETPRDVRESAAAKLAGGHNLTRQEVAAHLGVSAKKIQRMEGAGLLTRCPRLGTVVRFAASDVLRLASASSRKGA